MTDKPYQYLYVLNSKQLRAFERDLFSMHLQNRKRDLILMEVDKSREMTLRTVRKCGLTAPQFKAKLDGLLANGTSKIWLLKSAAGRVDVMFSSGDAQGKPIKNFDHIGGFYLMGENVPEEWMPQIHEWFLQFSRVNFTPYRLERHFIDRNQRAFYDMCRKFRDELIMHVPFSVHIDDEDSRP